jgi:hypothetical protein
MDARVHDLVFTVSDDWISFQESGRFVFQFESRGELIVAGERADSVGPTHSASMVLAELWENSRRAAEDALDRPELVKLTATPALEYPSGILLDVARARTLDARTFFGVARVRGKLTVLFVTFESANELELLSAFDNVLQSFRL